MPALTDRRRLCRHGFEPGGVSRPSSTSVYGMLSELLGGTASVISSLANISVDRYNQLRKGGTLWH